MRNAGLMMALVLAAGGVCGAEVSVTGVVQDPETRVVTVSYTLKSGPAIVTLDIRDATGVSLGGSRFRGVLGDVNRKVTGDGTHSFTWPAACDWPGGKSEDGLTIELKAWELDAPPPYMALDLYGNHALHFYECESLMPYPVTDFKYKTETMVFRKIVAKGVTYAMGSASPVSDTRFTRHRVTFTNDYYFTVYPVTIAQYWQVANTAAYYPQAALGNTPIATNYQNDATMYGRTRPIVGMSYRWYLRGNEQASGGNPSLNWPTGGHQVSTALFFYKLRDCATGLDFDLPTSAQWEYACRAGTGTKFNNGSDTDSSDVAWWSSNNVQDPDWVEGMPHAVGLKPANAWGLYDMHGNVGELCLDWMPAANSLPADAVDPPGPDSGTHRVVRGGSFAHGANAYSSGTFYSALPGEQSIQIGYRVAVPAEIK